MTTPKLDLDEAERLFPWDLRASGPRYSSHLSDAELLTFASTFVPLAVARIRELEAELNRANGHYERLDTERKNLRHDNADLRARVAEGGCTFHDREIP